MRFLCENCKAKYQIADEKLAGRAVRMKCRKCGHMIDVPALGTAPKRAAGAVAPAASAPKANAAAAAPAKPTEVAHPPRPAAPASAPAARPLTAVARSTQAQPASAAGGLAGAFHRSVQSPQESDVSAAIEVLSAGAGEEWYVGINGVPLGPVRLSAIRQKAAQGVINEDSLVWREGFEEWMPLRSFPELLTLLHEAREQGPRSSLSPAPPPVARRPASQPPPSHQQPATFSTSASLPGAMAPAEMSPTVPFVPPSDDDETATVIAQAPASAVGHVTSDPFAAPLPVAGMPAESLPAPSARVEVPLRSSAAPDEPMPRRSLVEDLAVGVRRQVRMHPAAYVLIALAGGFGITGAIVVFTGDKVVAPPPTIQVVTVTAPPPLSPNQANPANSGGARDITEVAVAGGRAAGAGAGAGEAAAGRVDPNDPNKGGGTTPARVGLGDGPNVGGPVVGGPNPAGGNVGQLEQADIERVVAAQRSSVKRRCWEPALAARDPKAPPSAKVNVSVTIGADGRVRGASASGGDGYPGLASCVQQRVAGWTFPPSSGESRANIPFAFFSQ